MKNPFKDLGKKTKAMAERMKETLDARKQARKIQAAKNPGRAKRVVDGFGDSCFIGGFTLLGTAAFAPVGTVPALIAGSIFVAIGGGAKFAASRMKGEGPELETALPQASPPAADEDKPALNAKPPGPDFTRAVKNDGAEKASPSAAPKPPALPPAGPQQQP